MFFKCYVNVYKGCVLSCQALENRVREEQKMMDKKIVAEMDQKVLDQQNTLEKAGVPGFFITTNPQVSHLKWSYNQSLRKTARAGWHLGYNIAWQQIL